MGSIGQNIFSTPPKDLHRWPAKVISTLTGGHVDNDSTVSVRYTGRCFCIHMSPRFLRNSPKATTLYLKYLQAIQPDGPGAFEEVYEEDVYEWIVGLFLPIFMRLAPEPLPSFDPDRIRSGEAKPALSEMPTIVKVGLDGLERTTTCFFKAFLGLGIPGGPLNRELDVYKNIHTSDLSEDVSVGRLVGVAYEHRRDSAVGLLLRYVDHQGTLHDAIQDNPRVELRKKWAAQIDKAVHELHRIGSVWGDAKPGNILIDKQDNAWITDFEGGYTPGWVDPDKAGTVEGDVQGLERIIRFIFEGPDIIYELR
ncbi:Protein kinase-like domain protein [Ophiocordyceps sinensis CO18]|uniref:Protein kinase-like domain protein n=1 Tax=Ophiocordyceps sinensis (strain Co18 / CGMCC 3.14243) TaxID=911162 RepID=T5ALX8_OPHSC|nr:Protein kinase-like domain protein [Ophiocordyceps sinensis CO18]